MGIAGWKLPRAAAWAAPCIAAIAAWHLLLDETLREAVRMWKERSGGLESQIGELTAKRDAHARANVLAASHMEFAVSQMSSPIAAVERIADNARALQLSGISYEVGEAIKRQHLVAVPLTLRMAGSFTQAVSFLREIEAPPLRSVVRALELVRRDGQNGVALEVGILVICRTPAGAR